MGVLLLWSFAGSAGGPAAWREELDRGDPTEKVLLDSLAEASRDECNIIIAARQDAPLLSLSARGPTATVRTLGFSSDSSRIYAGGLDKLVHAWDVTVPARSVLRTAANRGVYVQSLRWEIGRGPRGSVYAVAASPVDRRVAIAGYGARDASGDVILYDTARGQVERPLMGHEGAVAAVDFSPDGKLLASVDQFGSVRLWSAARQWTSREIVRPAGPPTPSRRVEFLAAGWLAVSRPADEGGRVMLVDVQEDQPRSVTLETPHVGGVTSIARDRQGRRWASADAAGHVFIWPAPAGEEVPAAQTLRKGRVALEMDFDPSGRLFVATALSRAEGDDRPRSTLELWDLARVEKTDEATAAEGENNFAIAVSPDGKRVVTFAGDVNGLRVYPLTDGEGNLLEQPLSRPPTLLKGTGRRVYNVAFEDAEGYRIGVAADPSREIRQVFDPLSGSLGPAPAEIRWRTPDADAAGWSIRRDPETPGRFRLFEQDQPRGSITLDPRQQPLSSHCWIPGPDGRPAAVAIGTDVQHGVYVFRIVADGECPLVRYFRDHLGRVNALCVSKDGKYLVSGAHDELVKIWSLEGLFNDDPFVSAWGATFALRNGKVDVPALIEAGAAARKGIRIGDTIVKARFASTVAEKFRPGERLFETSQPQQILDGLAAQPLTESVLLWIERDGSRLNAPILLIPAWEPLLNLFIDETGEWALWSPRGYYDASVGGDELFGWQMNRGVSVRPDYYRSDQLRSQLERPGVVRSLLRLGSIQEALRSERRPQREAPDGAIEGGVRELPRVTILSPTDGQEIRTPSVEVTARIEYPNPNLAPRVRGQAYVNGVRGSELAARDEGAARIYTWRVPCPDAHNRLRVIAETPDPSELLDSTDVHFRSRAVREGNPSMHLFLIAASQYKHLDKLELTLDDAKAIQETLRERAAKFYRRGETVFLRDDEVTRERVEQAVRDWKKRLESCRPDDLLVVFLAGHGESFDGEYHLMPIDVERTAKSAKERGVPWRTFRGLAEIACRKLFLMDSCHSGSTILRYDNEGMRWKNAIRPLNQDEMLVLSATDVGQSAYEGDRHGMFTQCLLDGMAGAADLEPKDGDVFLQELTPYVESEVPRRIERLAPSLRQTPRSSPAALFEAISVPLVASSPSSAASAGGGR